MTGNPTSRIEDNEVKEAYERKDCGMNQCAIESVDAFKDGLRCRFLVMVVAAFEDAPLAPGDYPAAAQAVMERVKPMINSAIRVAGFDFVTRFIPDPSAGYVSVHGQLARGRLITASDEERVAQAFSKAMQSDDEFPF